jgi:outer membrane receptor protein involved in Fe transport
VNTPGDVKTNGWGASVEYLLGKNYSVSGNLYSDVIGDLPAGFVSYFNTPKYRANIIFGNSGFGKKNRLAFNAVFRWTDSFFYEGFFGSGQMPAYKTVDAMVSYKFPETKSLIKLGATNLFNKYYRTGWGNPQIGGLYYISYGWNVF